MIRLLRRFRRHLLPRGFTKVRHYGLLANNTRRTLIPQARAAIAAAGGGKKPKAAAPPLPAALAWPPPCARCGATHVRCVALVRPDGHRVKLRPPRCERASDPP